MIFWKRFLGQGCSHRFAWPRVDANGCHYQICLQCGIAYEYDWTMTRRTNRLRAMELEAGVPPVRPAYLLLPWRRNSRVPRPGTAATLRSRARWPLHQTTIKNSTEWLTS